MQLEPENVEHFELFKTGGLKCNSKLGGQSAIRTWGRDFQYGARGHADMVQGVEFVVWEALQITASGDLGLKAQAPAVDVRPLCT